MTSRKVLSYILVLLVLVSFIFGITSQLQSVSAMPAYPTDETKVPHYFGPYPNWANSPYTLADAQVVITGNGSGAEAVASVGANGAVTGITITNPGHDYSQATVAILGSGTGATADVTIVKLGAVVAVTVDLPGSGYSAPVVTFSGNGGAAATAYGGVDAVTLTNGGVGYQFPTVDFDLPAGPGGVQAQGNVVCVELNCIPANPGDPVTIIGVDVVNPGSGYSTAPKVVIRDGTLSDPINHDPATFTEATATATLSIQSITLDATGADYNPTPTVTISDPTGTGAAATAALDNGVISAITLTNAGSGYVTAGGIQKFTDPLPGLCVPPACPTSGKYIPLGVPEVKTYNGA
ncbi:MAG: hypothetical protein WAM09_02660, partial [Anaerolineales bacterium]